MSILEVLLIGFDKKCLIRPRNMEKWNSEIKDSYGAKSQKGRTGNNKAQNNKRTDSRAVNGKNADRDGKPAKKKKTIRNVHKKKK